MKNLALSVLLVSTMACTSMPDKAPIHSSHLASNTYVYDQAAISSSTSSVSAGSAYKDPKKGIFVWRKDDVLSSEANSRELVNFCIVHGVNIVFMGMFNYLSTDYHSSVNDASLRQLISMLHRNGIELHAVYGSHDYGVRLAWVNEHILTPVQVFNTNSPSDSRIDAILYDAEYWIGGGGHHTFNDAIGMLDLIDTTKRTLNIPVGFSPPYWFAEPTNRAAIDVHCKWCQAKEGQCLINVADYLVIQDYFNEAGNQINHFSSWVNYAINAHSHIKLMLASDVDPPTAIEPRATYNTLQVGDHARLLQNLELISKTYRGSSVWWGNVIETYGSYKNLR